MIDIDEAHFDKDWGQAAKIVFDQSKKVFLIVTGSSALNLELSVDVARRSKREVMFPMNFSEFYMF
jgi:predicted AAA+ superfamily ATPase